MNASRAITEAEMAALVDSLRAYLREMADIPVEESKRLQAEIDKIMAAKPPDAASAAESQKRRPRASDGPEPSDEHRGRGLAADLQPLHADDKAVISKLGYEGEVQQLRQGILDWVATRTRKCARNWTGSSSAARSTSGRSLSSPAAGRRTLRDPAGRSARRDWHRAAAQCLADRR